MIFNDYPDRKAMEMIGYLPISRMRTIWYSLCSDAHLMAVRIGEEIFCKNFGKAFWKTIKWNNCSINEDKRNYFH